jgi:hypothetical protein
MAFPQFDRLIPGTRKGAGVYTSGTWVPTAPTNISIRGSVQPASENELRLLPEGRREDGAYAIRSRSEIRTGDVFTIVGQAHEVIRAQVWQNGVIPHYLGIAVRVQP